MPENSIRIGEHGARVMIEDEEIEHYAIDLNPAEKEVTCWIASEEGKEFSVVWLDLDLGYTSAGNLYLDGQYATSFTRKIHDSGPIAFEDRVVSESSCAPFLFSPLVVTDDDTYLDTSPSYSIGEIKLVIVRTTKPKKSRKQVSNDPAPLHLQKVHERSKKGITHQVNYGPEIPCRTIYKSVEEIERLATFIFRYRPLEMLRANGIVPQNPEPLEPQERTLNTPPSTERMGEHSKVNEEPKVESELETDDEDDMREKALLAELEKIRKGKHLKDSKRPKKKLKKEDNFKPNFTPGEIIDLT